MNWTNETKVCHEIVQRFPHNSRPITLRNDPGTKRADRRHWYADRNRTAFDTTSLVGTRKIDAANMLAIWRAATGVRIIA